MFRTANDVCSSPFLLPQLCWAPFFITHIVMGICASACDINKEIVYSIVTW